jgi:hypothetical protein
MVVAGGDANLEGAVLTSSGLWFNQVDGYSGGAHHASL